MKKYQKYLMSALWGGGYAGLVLLLSRWFLRGLSSLFSGIGGLMGMGEGDIASAQQILDQLRDADLCSPWILGLIAGLLLGGLSGVLRKKRKASRIAAAVLLLLPMVFLTLWFTKINDIRLGAFLSMLFPMLPHLL